MDEVAAVAGQLLSSSEAEWAGVTADILAQTQQVPAISKVNGKYICARCGGVVPTSSQRLPSGVVYCGACIALGRISSDMMLWQFPQPHYAPAALQMSWHGQLTPQQVSVADELIATYQTGGERLLWAVTGAGKTEMLFPLLEQALAAGTRVAIVSPRIDVILELAPRIAAAFADVPLAVRYGGSGPQAVGQLLLATVHQLLRFKKTFGLIIVDEVDAFPYAADPVLERAVRSASCGARIFLTATPSASLLARSKRGQLAISYLPRRFHGFPLPLPQVIVDASVTKLSARARGIISRVIRQCARTLIFVPAVEQLRPLQLALAKLNITAETVYSAEPLRKERVQRLRQGEVNVLISTTILERGVTFPNCGVIVLQADAPLFATSALVQMAGRAGRAKEHPADPVYFLCRNYNLAIAGALRQIKQMNRRRA
ncbi:helicase-related protein [Lacticaseibacillus zhaodongensis]|uniref:helicase-related protein n=1 Tax=Lacticaseibacillus zhaodongensis TaxID=2668065 RepID=UPI0018AF95DA|nr:helicase-related protein [Lacticaseibacillus zhaodongensis]